MGNPIDLEFDPNEPIRMIASPFTNRGITVPNKSCDAGLAGAAAPEAPKRVVPNPEDSLKTGPALGMLALGTIALPVWRRDELAQSKQ